VNTTTTNSPQLGEFSYDKLDLLLYTLIFGMFPINRQLHLIICVLALGILLLKNKEQINLQVHLAIFSGIFVLLTVISALKAHVPTFSIYVSSCWILSFLLFFHLSRQNYESVKRHVILSLKISFALSTFLLAIYICYEAVQRGEVPVINKSEIVHTYFRTENFVSSYLVLLMPLAFIKTKYRYLDKACILALLISIYLVISGVSQSNIILTLLAAILLVFKYWKSIKSKIIIVPISLLILAVLFIFFQTRSSNLKVVNEMKGLTERYELWNSTFNVIGENPIVGVGLGNWMIDVEKFLEFRSQIVHPHNLYLELASEISPLAMLIFLWLFFIPIGKQLLKIKSNSTDNSIYIISLLTYIINSFLYGTINHQYMAFSQINFIAFAILFLIIVKDSYSKYINIHRAFVVIMSILVGVIFIYQTSIYPKNTIITNLKTFDKSERKQLLIEQYNANIYSHRTKHNSIAALLVKKYDLSPNEIKFFTQELAFQYPYKEEYISNYIDQLKTDGEYAAALDHYKNLELKLSEDLSYKLKLAELYYLNNQIEEGNIEINVIREAPIESLQKIGVEKSKNITSIKSKAFALHKKFNKN